MKLFKLYITYFVYEIEIVKQLVFYSNIQFRLYKIFTFNIIASICLENILKKSQFSVPSPSPFFAPTSPESKF